MNKEVFEKLALLEATKKQIEEQIKEVRVEVEEEMKKAEVDKVEADYGTFFFTTKRRWTYSDSVTVRETELKKLKKEEEEKGVAVAEEVKALTFRAVGKIEE